MQVVLWDDYANIQHKYFHIDIKSVDMRDFYDDMQKIYLSIQYT